MEAPEVVRNRVRFAEHDHERVPGLALLQHAGERRAPSDAVEQARQRHRMPTRTGRDLLEVGERHAPDDSLDVRVERTGMDERAVDGGRERAVEAAHHDTVDRLGRVRRRDRQDGDPPRGGVQVIPQRRHPPEAAVHEAQAVRPGYRSVKSSTP